MAGRPARHRPLAAWAAWVVVVGAAGMLACSPALDWREVAAEQGPVRALFPCKPQLQTRQVPLAGPPVALALQTCTAADMRWALASADLGDPARVGPALRALRAAAAANLEAATAGMPLPLSVRGATPQPDAGRAALSGQRPDGAPAQSQVAVFAVGTRVYQATVLGTQVQLPAADIFFAALQVLS